MTTTANKEFKGAAAATTTTNAINAIDTAVSISSATGWPTGAQSFTAVIDRGASNEEKVLCSARSGLGLTISQRGYDNTATSSHAAGAKIEHCIAATDLTALFNHATNTGIDDHTQYLLKTLAASTYLTIANASSTYVALATRPTAVTALVTTAQSTTSTAYVDLTTTGPSVDVTVPASGMVKVTLTASIAPDASGYGLMGFAASGANTIAAGASSRILAASNAASGGVNPQTSAAYLLTGLTAGVTTFKAMYARSGGTTAQFGNRSIIVETVP